MKKFSWLIAAAAILAALVLLNTFFGMKGTMKRNLEKEIGMHCQMAYVTPKDGFNKTYVAMAVKSPVEDLDAIQTAISDMAGTLWDNGVIKYGIILIAHPDGLGQKVTPESFDAIFSPTREGMEQIFMYTSEQGYKMMDYNALQEAVKEAGGN